MHRTAARQACLGHREGCEQSLSNGHQRRGVARTFLGAQRVPVVSREGPRGARHPAREPTQGSACSSCRPFALSDLDDYERHFTVMNYDPEAVLKQVRAWRGLGSGFTWARSSSHQPVYWAGCADSQRGCPPAPG